MRSLAALCNQDGPGDNVKKKKKKEKSKQNSSQNTEKHIENLACKNS